MKALVVTYCQRRFGPRSPASVCIARWVILMPGRNFLLSRGVCSIVKKILALIFTILIYGWQGFGAETNSRPNIILILADDLGIGNVSCYGADNFKTPRIDALAKGGIRFEHCYAQPLCGPSRAQLLTGRYALRTGMTGNDSGPLVRPESEVMIPKVMKPAGYVTAQVGKWGQLKLQPADFGFDEYLRFQNSGVYWSDDSKDGAVYTVNGKASKLAKDKYLPDLMHEFLVDFVTRHRDQPFFVYYAMSHVHRNVPHLGMRPTPDSVPNSQNLFADNITYMDKLVGKLVDELERLKLREKTLIIFVGDNGTGGSEAAQSTVHGKSISGHKGDLLEGGSLVPMIVNWPGTTPAGVVSPNLMDFSDYLPTLAELGGAKLPTGVTIDGRSFAAQLRGGKGQARDWVFVELGTHWYARNLNWKLHENGELFDMRGAPFRENLVRAGEETVEAKAECKRLQGVLDQLNPASGKVELGNPSGKHDKKAKQQKKV
jgi:arylsulfatase A